MRVCSCTKARTKQRIHHLKLNKNVGFVIAIVLMVAAGCTTRRDGFSYRVFHNTTARYNGYFYAKEAMREADMQLLENHDDDYDQVLPLFIYGDEESATAIFPQMERAIEKSSLVVERHKMEPAKRDLKKSKRPEMNKWIDDNYLLIGQAYFYKRNYFKAEEMFLFISRKYKEKEVQALANAWLTRCYLEREDFTRAKNAILKAAQLKNLEDEVKAEVQLVYTDYFIRQEKWKEASEELERAIKHIDKKKDKARPTFILAQLMQRQNKSQDAIAYYNAVLKLRPEYEMEFYAKIMQAMAFDRRGGNSGQIKETLFKLLKDEKNLEYQDQIYYALAELELEEQNRNQGVDYLKTSLAVNQGNKRQKMKSFLRLADLYLEDKDYPNAQAYYDSTYRNIEEDHPRYQDVENKATSLTELVTYLNVIDEQDSLAVLCGLGEEELVERITEIRKQQLEEIEAARAAAEAAAAAGDVAAIGGQGAFWPYNPQLKDIGQRNFLDYWGSRPLEDNWRRSQKLNTSFDGEEEEEVVEGVVEEVKEEGDGLPSVDEMIAALPCGEEGQSQSKTSIADAYYNSGVIYREKLEDLDNAIEQWEVLVSRYDDSELHPTAYYLLYRTYLFKEQQGYKNPFCGTCSSKYWGDIILEKYPGSEWALLVENPEYQDYAELKRSEEAAAYETELNKYYQRRYQEVITNTDSVIRTEPDNHLICKYKLLNARATGNMDGFFGMRDNYIDRLQKLIQECPDTEEAAYAQEQLDQLSEEKKEPKKEDKKEEEEEEVSDSPFVYKESSRHYFMMILPVKGSNVNNVKAELSDFAKGSFGSMGLKVSSNLIDRDNQVVLVKTFNRLDDGTSFLTAFEGSDDVKQSKEGGYPYSLISKENYVTLFKTKDVDGYQKFFKENY